MDFVDKIIEYESGEMTGDDMVDFFGELVKTGQAWTLQGHYGRMASSLIENGYLDHHGEVLKYPGEMENARYKYKIIDRGTGAVEIEGKITAKDREEARDKVVMREGLEHPWDVMIDFEQENSRSIYRDDINELRERWIKSGGKDSDAEKKLMGLVRNPDVFFDEMYHEMMDRKEEGEVKTMKRYNERGMPGVPLIEPSRWYRGMYEEQRQRVCDEINKFLADEKQAGTMDYPELAKTLKKEGYDAQSRMVAGISKDEKRHRKRLKNIAHAIGCKGIHR